MIIGDMYLICTTMSVIFALVLAFVISVEFAMVVVAILTILVGVYETVDVVVTLLS